MVFIFRMFSYIKGRLPVWDDRDVYKRQDWSDLRKISSGTGNGRNGESQQYECISKKDHSYGRIASTDRRNIEKWEDKKCCI